MEDLDSRPTWAEINLDALEHNYQEIRRIVGNDTKILGVVKADAYGHGSLECAKTLVAVGIDMLAVAFIDEAIALRQGGITAEILLLGFTPESAIPDLIKWNIIPGVYQIEFAIALSEYCLTMNTIHPIHIKVDTGMGRIGFLWKEAPDFIEKIDHLKGIRIEGLYSHYSTADAFDKGYSEIQTKRFKDVIREIEEKEIHIPIKHIANSAGIFDLEGVHFDMVRPGIILYGLYPSKEVDRTKIDLKPVMRLKTTIVHIKTIQKGDSISYGNQFIADEKRIIGTLPIGYADGLSRVLSNQISVWINDTLVPIVGNICMDQCMVDLSKIKATSLYDEVEIFGENQSADILADRMGSINYEITCMVNKRVPRLYYYHSELKTIRYDIFEKPFKNRRIKK
jgi:alanine racemase